MSSAASSQSERLNFRLGAEQKSLVARAAATRGQSLTDFAKTTLLEAARLCLREAEVTTLSDHDRDLFLSLLDADDEPNADLRAAAARYKQDRE